MAYGTPASTGEVEAYYTHIRGGRPPQPEHLADLIRRYQMIGGVSPLTPISLSLAHKLENRLNLPVYVGMRHAAPFIADTLSRMAGDGVTEIVAIPLAPHYSKMSIGAYVKAAQEGKKRLAEEGSLLEMSFVESWSSHPLFISAITRRIERAAMHLVKTEPEAPSRDGGLNLPEDATVLFTAHSLPEAIRAHGDPYERELETSCTQVAEALQLRSWHLAYQSAGSSSVPWLGPDITELLPELAASGVRQAIVCPIGFVADHLEVYYDIDVEAQTVAREVGIRLVRTESLNDHDDFVAILASLVEERMGGGAPEA